jgi:formylglycine-generating enzyme required for sulfatase activity
MPLTPNTTIINGKYHILRLIGEGGMARVWLAEEVHFGRQVAIKEPHAGLGSTDSEELRQRFLREVKISAALAKAKTPNIVQALTAEPYEGGLLLVMAYMPGDDLETLLEQHPGGLPIDRALEITQDVLTALAAVHRHPLYIVHRDIKPSNILFDGEGGAHLGDFGLAQVAGWSQGRSLMMGGAQPGTPLYMAPEQAIERGYLTPAADMYALGAVLFEMLTGKKYKRYRPGTRASELRAETPAWLDDLVAKALAEDLWERWQTGGEMLAAALAAGQEEERRAQAEAARQAEMERQRREEKAAAAERRRQEKARKKREAEEKARQEAEARAKRQRQEAERRAQADAARQAELERQRQEKEAAQVSKVVRDEERSAQADLRPPAHRARIHSATELEKQRQKSTGRGAQQATRGRSKWLYLTPLLILAGLVVFWLSGGITATSPLIPTATPRPTATPIPTLAPDETPVAGSAIISEKDGMKMVYVPAGEFLMGSPDSKGSSDEHPQHTVYLDAFWIDRTEVTNAMYQKCVAADACPPNSDYGSDFNDLDQPVVGVSWNDAQAYCQWADRRLPTEAEWEKAARETDGRTYPWGNVFDGSKLNYCDKNCSYNWKDEGSDDGYQYTAPVGSYPAGASPYGALDMAGNVWEWVGDWYVRDYYVRSPDRNPTGPDSGQSRVLRGGSWNNAQINVRSANRINLAPVNRDNNFGFRCALSQ